MSLVPEVNGPPLEVTVAVNVTDCPKVDGFGLALSAVVVAWPAKVPLSGIVCCW